MQAAKSVPASRWAATQSVPASLWAQSASRFSPRLDLQKQGTPRSELEAAQSPSALRTRAHASDEAEASEALARMAPGTSSPTARPRVDRGEQEMSTHELPQRWRRFSHLATGCREEYIPAPSDTGLRISRRHLQPMADPVAALQEGLPVHFLHPTDRKFEHRVLKTDNRKSFLYLLRGGVDAKSQDPFVMRLQDVEKVHGGREAMRICESHSVHDPFLDVTSAVVVQMGESQTDIPPVDKVWVFIAPPREQLKAILKAVVDEVAHAAVKPLATPSSPTRAAITATTAKASKASKLTKKAEEQGRGEKEFWWRLDGVRIRDLHKLFGQQLTDRFQVDMELLLWPVDDKGHASGRSQSFVHTAGQLLAAAPPDLLPAACRREVERLQELLGCMPPVDGVRLAMTLLELALLTRWVQDFTDQVKFEGGLYKYVTDQRALMIGRSSKSEEREIVGSSMPAMPTKADPLDSACRPSLRAAVAAVRQILDVDDLFVEVAAGRLKHSSAWSHGDALQVTLRRVLGLPSSGASAGLTFLCELVGKPESRVRANKVLGGAGPQALLKGYEPGDRLSIGVWQEPPSQPGHLGSAAVPAELLRGGLFEGEVGLQEANGKVTVTLDIKVEVTQSADSKAHEALEAEQAEPMLHHRFLEEAKTLLAQLPEDPLPEEPLADAAGDPGASATGMAGAQAAGPKEPQLVAAARAWLPRLWT